MGPLTQASGVGCEAPWSAHVLADGRIEGRRRTPLGLGIEGGEFSQSQGAPGTHLGAHEIDDGIKAALDAYYERYGAVKEA